MALLTTPEIVPTKFQPINQRNFIFAIEGIDSYLIKTGNLPTITTEAVMIDFFNAQRKIAGKTTFGDLQVTLHSPVAPSGQQQVMEWLRLCYEPVSGRGGYADFYKRDIQIKLADPVGNEISLWDIKGAFITEANFGALTFSASDLVEISLTIAYDVCTLLY